MDLLFFVCNNFPKKEKLEINSNSKIKKFPQKSLIYCPFKNKLADRTEIMAFSIDICYLPSISSDYVYCKSKFMCISNGLEQKDARLDQEVHCSRLLRLPFVPFELDSISKEMDLVWSKIFLLIEVTTIGYLKIKYSIASQNVWPLLDHDWCKAVLARLQV